MSYSIQNFPDESIIVFLDTADFSVSTDLASAVGEVRALLDAAPAPVYLVWVALNAHPPSMEEVFSAANALARGKNPLFHHPNIKRLLVASKDQLLRMAFVGARSEIFGNLQSVLFDSLEAALQYARAGK